MFRIPLTLLCMLAATWASADTTRVLFLGNSYTYTNDLPFILSELAASMGETVEYDSNLLSGYTLSQHTTNATSLELIQQGDWDYVVLQEQSQLPSFPDFQVEADFFPPVQTLVDEIRAYNQCGIPLLFMTWGREEGDAQNCDNWPPVCTYEGMQELLTQRYLEACDLTDSWCAPVGMAWQDIFENTGIDLYTDDGSHPSLAGTYLAASTMFVAMFGENPGTSVYDAGLTFEESQTLDGAAWDLWQNDPDAFHQTPLLDAELIITPGDFGTYIEVSTSSYVDSVVVNTGSQEFVWEDGDVSQLFLSQTTYFDVTAYSSCTSPIQFLDSLVIEDPSAILDVLKDGWQVFPNPVQSDLTLTCETAHSATLLLRNSSGQTVRQAQMNGTRFTWNLSDVPSGWYVLEVQEEGAALKTTPVLIQR